MLRVLIADDDARIRDALKRIINRTSDMTVVAEAASGSDALDKICSVVSDIVLLDISMSDMNGLEVLNLARHLKPDLPILMVSVHPADVYAERAISEGASGYITKDRVTEQLVDTIRRIVSVLE